MNELIFAVVAVFLVYFVLALLFAWLYEQLVRRSILNSVRTVGGELIKIDKLRARAGMEPAKRPVQPKRDRGSWPRYVVRYRTKRGEELTRLCTLSPSGQVNWYDES